ncbi:MAG: adenylosuccinate synthase [Chloroflexi bacterium]|nr:adenylosuccinate synthase [Chloroflexota bacterium]
MPVIIAIGAQWGDEGKGKIVDMLAERADMVVRFSGGDNAGHTVVNSFGEFGLHLVPSGIFSSRALAVIGNGVVVNPAVLLQELAKLNERGVDTSRLAISDRAHVIMPYHIMLDKFQEQARAGKAIGTTGKGIGPAFADKATRHGVRMVDIIDSERLRERLTTVLEYNNTIMTRVYGASPLSLEEVHSEYCRYGEQLAPYIRDTSLLLDEAIARGQVVLLEGAQGALLDPDFGTYPFTTSSSPLSGGGCLGAGVPPTRINQVLGVFKAYCTRVGGGPMPTELKNEMGQAIRELGHEYGTTTGRPRRCGWFDGVAARFSTRINGFTSAAITRLDVLDTLPSLKICIAYRLDGQIIEHFPASATDLERCEPVYEEFPGWQTPISDIRRYDRLPVAARRYMARLEEIINCPVSLVSVGTRREETIYKMPDLMTQPVTQR